MSDWSEHYLRAKTALSLAEREFTRGRYGAGCKALDAAVMAIRCTQATFKLGHESRWEAEQREGWVNPDKEREAYAYAIKRGAGQ